MNETTIHNKFSWRKTPLWRMFDLLANVSRADSEQLRQIEKESGDPRLVRAMVDYTKEHPNPDRTPQIAVIGKTGVGKSTTINMLFNPQPNLLVDHVEPATPSIQIIPLALGDRGKLIFVDCPGLGDSEEADNRNIVAYQEILRQSDVAVWILKADDRTLGIDLSFIRQVLPKELKHRLVVGINQVDKIEPGEWNLQYNLPSRAQEVSIDRRVDGVSKRLSGAGINPFAIVPYSAKRNFHLLKLFRAMIDAAPADRVPSLVKRSDLEFFVSPQVLDAMTPIEVEK